MRLELQGPVGISRLPEQTIQKAIKKGFAFNLLVVGVYSNRAWLRNASNLWQE
jgi:septin family protein